MPRPSQTKIAVIAVIGSIVLVGLVGILVWRSLNAPAVGTVINGSPTSEEEASKTPKPKTYEGKYLSFEYPGDYRQVPSQDLEGVGERLNLVGPNSASIELALTIRPGKIADDSSVNLRRLKRNEYAETIEHGYLVFSKKSGFEKAWFDVHDGMIASLVLTDRNGGDRSAEFESVITSLRWNR